MRLGVEGAIRRASPSGAIVPSTPTTGWWRVALSEHGRKFGCTRSCQGRVGASRAETPPIPSHAERDNLAMFGPDAHITLRWKGVL
jgi:hypothetical protein